MNSLRNIWNRLLFLLLVSTTTAAPTSTFAQNSLLPFDLRVGKGTSLTEPVHRSVFVSMPVRSYGSGDVFMLYLEKSLLLSEEQHGLDVVVGFAPMMRIGLWHQYPRLSVEAGVGVNIITTRAISGRQLGSNLLFSPTVSAGMEIPWSHGSIGLMYMFRHLSNASMFEDNDGINYQYIIFSFRFIGM